MTEWTAVTADDSSWSAADDQNTTWVQTAQSGKVEAMFEYDEPLGGPVWTASTKISTTTWE